MKGRLLMIFAIIFGFSPIFIPGFIFGENLDDEFQNAMEICTKSLKVFASGTMIQNSTHYFDDSISCHIFDNRMIKGPDDVSAEERIYENLPWVSRSYDYVDNALDVRIDPKYFTEENIPKYIEIIRSVVGDEIDLTIGLGEPISLEACSSRATGECEPIKGGVRFMPDNLSQNTSSVGFKATYNGKTGFVTAGHAFINDAGYQIGGTNIKQSPSSSSDIGNKNAMNISKGVATWCDCAFVEENSFFRSMDDGVYGLSDPNAVENPYINQIVTMSGGYSGLKSGIVTSTNVDYTVDLDGNGSYETPIYDAIRGGYSSQGGDSGSPIVGDTSGKLLGIHVASTGVFMKHSAVTNSFPGLTWGF